MAYNVEKIGQIIAEQRRKHGLTQKELGDIVHCSGKQIHNYESAATMPSIDMLFKLCEVFKCEFGFLLGEPDYSEGTRIETAIHKGTGLTKEAMDSIRLLTSTEKKAPRFGYESEEFRSLLNRFLTSKHFFSFMDEILNLDEAFQKCESIMLNLEKQIGNARYAAARDLSLEIESLAPEGQGANVTQEELADLRLLQKADDEAYNLSYVVKVHRYEVREAFETLLEDLFPRRANE